MILALMIAIASANNDDLNANCESPRAAISSLLDNLQHNNAEKAVSCFELQRVNRLAAAQRTAIHLKQLLDARGIYSLRRSFCNADHKNEMDEHISRVSEYLDGVYLERRNAHWVFPKSSQQEISRQYTDTFSFLLTLEDALFKSFIGLQRGSCFIFCRSYCAPFLASS